MGKTFSKSENTRKAAGNAKKAAAAANKQATADAQAAAREDQDWAQGSKSSSRKRDDAAAKKVEAAAKKAERDAQLAAEEANARSAPKNSKSAAKKVSAAPVVARGLDLGQLDEGGVVGNKTGGLSSSLPALNASGIDNALDALTLTGSSAAAEAGKVDRHPERRFKAAYTAYETRRLAELEVENPGLRRNQRVDMARREFAKHPDNPFNQAAGRFDSTGAELKEIADRERARMEGMLGGT